MSITAPLSRIDHKLYRRRFWINRIAITLAILAMLFGLFWLFWILWETLVKGISGLSMHIFTESTPSPNDEGGLLNALFGSFVIVAMATGIGTPIGIMAGICLSEYSPKGPLATVTRFINDILLSAPSIIIGIFVWIVMVQPMGRSSAYAGAVALALIVIPVVIRTTENMLTLVPVSLREAGYALGAPKWWVISTVSLRAAKAGVLTGILLALARISGETAPLLFTALNNQFWSTDLGQPMANLPTVIFKFAMSPYQNWQELAWAGVFLLTLAVLLFNILARFLARPK